MSPEDHPGAWEEYRRLVLAELNRLDRAITGSEARLLEEVRGLRSAVNSVSTSVTALQAKAGLLGFLAGLAASFGASLLDAPS